MKVQIKNNGLVKRRYIKKCFVGWLYFPDPKQTWVQLIIAKNSLTVNIEIIHFKDNFSQLIVFKSN